MEEPYGLQTMTLGVCAVSPLRAAPVSKVRGPWRGGGNGTLAGEESHGARLGNFARINNPKKSQNVSDLS